VPAANCTRRCPCAEAGGKPRQVFVPKGGKERIPQSVQGYQEIQRIAGGTLGGRVAAELDSQGVISFSAPDPVYGETVLRLSERNRRGGPGSPTTTRIPAAVLLKASLVMFLVRLGQL